MNIKDLTNQEKSVLLAKAVGWKIVFPPDWCDYDEPFADLIDANHQEIDVLLNVYPSKPWDKFNLYNPSNMYLACHIFRWFYKKHNRLSDTIAGASLKILIGKGGVRWGLDRIVLSLLEAGMIELDKETKL